MKRKSLIVSFMLLAFALILTSCGGGGSSSSNDNNNNNNTTPTTVSTTDQGAQAAAVGANAAMGVVSGEGQLSGLAAMGTAAPQINIPSDSRIAQTMGKLAQRLSPMVKKARSFKATGTYSAPCDNSTGSIDITANSSTSFTMVFNSCQQGSEITNGTLSFTCTDSSCTTMTMNFGTTAVTPFTDSYCTDYTCNTLDSITSAFFSMTISATLPSTAGGNYSESISANGYVKDQTVNPASLDEVDFNNMSMNINFVYDSTAGVYSMDFTLNGGITDTYSESGAVVYAEQDSFSNLTMNWTATGALYTWAINGTFSVNFTPDQCFEGTFTFTTIDPVAYNFSTGLYEGGHITVNGADVVYNSDGSVTVTVNGVPQTYTGSEFDGLCALQ